MKSVNRKRIERIEKARRLEQSKSSYALVIYSPEIREQIDSLEINADPKGGYQHLWVTRLSQEK